MGKDIKRKIEEANAEAVGRMMRADPVLIDVAPAGEVIPGIQDKMLLHAGPPVDWQHMCGAQRGAAIGMVLFEHWAESEKGAVSLLEDGGITLEPNHHHDAVGSMAGTTTRSIWVFVVEDRTSGHRVFCRDIDARQSFGDYSADALKELECWRDIWAPSLRAGIRQRGGLSLKPIIARALQMGDELHNRNSAASSLFGNVMAMAMVEAGVPKDPLVSTLRWLSDNDLCFLSLSMASAKAIADAARGIEYSTVVVAMCRNGTEFGVRVSGLGDEWFTAPAPRIDGLFLPGYKEEHAGLDMGDSAITETVGWGGFVIGGAPAVLSRVGGTPEEALSYTREMYHIAVTTNSEFLLPALGFKGGGLGIDIRKVVHTSIVPVINTGIAHKNPGYPIIGAGHVRPPLECFKKALTRFAERYQG